MENVQEIIVSTDKSLLDYEAIYRWLEQSYWANHRSKETINKSIENSYCYGVYSDGKQIGFARIVTDWATTYWLCDVVIDEAYRGKGIGKKLIEKIVGSPEFEGLPGYLGTADAHGLYEQYGFEKNADRFMVRRPQ